MTQQTGFPIGNFGIAGEVSPDGRLLPRVLYNPPVLGPWLEELGQGRFLFTCDGVTLADSEFAHVEVDRLFPEATAGYADPRFDGMRVTTTFLAPIKAGDALACSIPAISVDIEFANEASQAREVSARFEFVHVVDEPDISLLSADGFRLVGGARTKIGFDNAISWEAIDGGISVAASVSVPPRGSARLRFLLACHESDGYYTTAFPAMTDLVSWVSENWGTLKTDRARFIELLPRTHDEQVNRYLRWYVSAAILLTRLTREHVLTMGYCELNQRDSYWTSWPHLVLWPDLERRMIEESAEHQRADGKIPTTILPTIEREDDIDINCYFNLRIARYYEWTRDLDFVRQLWPSYKRSIEYLKSMDKDADGLLDQGSFWGDWKDVIGVEGRKAAPHFEFLWLAVLKSAQDYIGMLDDTEALAEYEALYDRASSAVNAPVESGGLWNGRFYTTQWYDGREDNHCQQDQCVGPLFGVAPEDHIPSVFGSIDRGMTEWGIRDTWPYREVFNNVGGDYHNGGVWIFLNFADALSRFVAGYPNASWEILKRVGHWDLEKWGDYMPAEYLDGNTGANAGKPIQGWDACFFAAVLFGALGVKVLSPGVVQVQPRIVDTEAFSTSIPLPWGVIWVRHDPGPDALTVELRSDLSRPIQIRYGAMTARSADDCTRERVGECEFAIQEATLHPGAIRTLVFR